MDVVSPKAARRFRKPENWFPEVGVKVAAVLLEASADITLVIDPLGAVVDVALGSDEVAALNFDEWIGKQWIDLVAGDSRQKTKSLLDEATEHDKTRWREVNYLTADGSSVPVSCTAVRLGPAGDVVVFGRDLTIVSRLQQRVVDIQRSMERDYARLRNAETRYRLLFQMASEAVVIVDIGTGKIVEANPAAGRLMGLDVSRMVDRAFRDLFDPSSKGDLESLILSARAIGRADEGVLKLPGAVVEFAAGATLFRQDNQQYLLVRLSPRNGDEGGSGVVRSALQSVELLKRFPEAFVAIDPDGHILEANHSFLELVELASIDQARGASVERWIGRPGVDVNLLVSNLREHGAIRDFATIARGELGANESVDVTAVYVSDTDRPCIGMIIRMARRRSGQTFAREAGLSPSVENLTQLVGTMPLKDLVRETTDMIEQMCIEAALKLTDDNRASAAQILGLSRQSLYAKLHRFGIGDLGPYEG
jgi:transcriptional regulator PpsR